MNDIEINRALALKIGYLPDDVMKSDWGYVMVNRPTNNRNSYWHNFDYTDWNTIMPIAVKYGVLCGSDYAGYPFAYSRPDRFHVNSRTIQRAIALAVLGVKE